MESSSEKQEARDPASFVRTSTALRFRVAMLMRERRRPRPSLGRASTESRYDLEFAEEMRNEYLYVVLQATLTRNGKRYRVKRLIDVVTRQFSNIILIRLTEHV